jgi:serine/threonine protein kinase/Tol biopolymer transport system component
VIGKAIGPYQVVAKLGEGGMGEVYRAQDTRLNRAVALKVLPRQFAADPLAQSRFVREGQVLAALAHPNLVAIYDVGTANGVSYAVMELVDGETLRAKLIHGRLSIRRTIDYASQIARGLAAAHDKGLVHRDLKPANIIVAANGQVKILDFGLAKAVDAPAETRPDADTVVQTDPGMVLGTVGYMAPEQVRGLATDARTDLFAFGAVLYETLTGGRAFDRESAAETMTAIVKDDPPAIPAALDVPPALDRIVRRCLEKRPDDRFRSASDLAFQLETLSAPTTGRSEPVGAHDAPRRPRFSVFPAAALFGAGLVVGWLVLARIVPTHSSAPPPAPTRISTITFSGSDLLPAASPDGRTIAFTSMRDGVSRIWLRQLQTGEEAALTTGVDRVARFSPDGASILFARRDDQDSALYRIPVLGGQPRKLVDHALEGDWSPDGTHLAFIRQVKAGEWRVAIANADGTGIRLAGTPSASALRAPRWAPDGKSFVVVQSGIQATILDNLLVYDAATLSATPINPLEAGGHISVVQWVGTDFLYAQSPDVTSYVPESRVVLQHRSGGGRILAWVPSFVDGFDLLRDGSILFDTSANRQNLHEYNWTTTGLATRRWLTRGTSMDRQPSYSPDGKWVVFSTARNGNLDLWTTSTDTGETRRITDDQAQDWDPAFTPDGRQLVWSSNRSGHFEIWIAEADGRNARQLSRDGFDAENPTMTRDGWVIYSANFGANQGIWKIRADGTQATRIISGINAHPEVSPDGLYVLYHTEAIGSGQVHVARIADGQQMMPPIALPPAGRLLAVISLGRGRWRPDGRAFLYVGMDAKGESVIVEQAFRPGEDTTATRRVLKASEEGLSLESFGVSPDGTRVTISFLEDQYAIMRLEGLQWVKGR